MNLHQHHATAKPEKRAGADRISIPFAVLSAVLTGLLAGGMVLIEAVLLPFWRGIPPADFRRWFTAHAHRIRAVMIPLGMGAGVASTVSTSAHLAGHGRSSGASATATAATLGVIAITVAVSEPANHRFTAGELTDTETRDLLQKWARWHHVRVVLGLAATVAATTAILKRKS